MTLTVKQVQQYLGISEGSVLHLISTKQLKAINVGRDPGKQRARWRVTEEALKSFCESRSSAPTPPNPVRRRRKLSGDVTEFIK